MKNFTNNNESSFTDFNFLSILFSRPVRMILISGITMLIAFFIGK